ncbi:MAG TPA: NrfD/PsrC family molybdoenzyme membrane anchor subunit [Candidatus Dormibacteraeota bacterium]|nr:NrfD/PsrC family molybdoenzyme membrane anchor subunit [Candidatus Dormibacteraeota bacterium]
MSPRREAAPPVAHPDRPGYAGQPVLNAPPWHHLIIWYFFLGGISGTAYVIAVLARWFGGARGRPLARAGHLVSAAAIAPAPALLILDLGRPARFHHMLRLFKPLSPMNLGSWAFTGFSAASALGALRTLSHSAAPLPALLRRAGRLVPELLSLPGAVVALFFSGYTGTLLAATAVPLWARTPLLGPLFTASAAATGGAAVQGVLAVTGDDGAALELPERAALAAEVALAATWLHRLGPVARRPLMSGRQRGLFWGGYAGAGLALPLALSLLPGDLRHRRSVRLVSAAATLAGGFCLRAAVVRGGEASALDPEAVLGAAGGG